MSVVTTFLADLGRGLGLALSMAWDTWWALVLGFTIAGAVETFVSEDDLTDRLGDDGWREASAGTAFGVATSSCSFSAVATAKTLFEKGASPVVSLGAFQFAATDLVVDIGLIMWVLLGWQFVAADYVGGLIAVAVLVVIYRRVPSDWWDTARDHVHALDETACATCGMAADPTDDETVAENHDDQRLYFCCSGCQAAFDPETDLPSEIGSGPPELTSIQGWQNAASNAIREWDMLWVDVAIGYLVSGLIAAFVPRTWWTALFGTGDGLGVVVGNAAIAIVVAVVTFVCSVGNVPFALVLWNNGIAFGAVLTFIFADLIIPPIVNTYRRYYGWRVAALLFVSTAVAAVVAGVAVHYLFSALSLVPPTGQTLGTAPDEYTLVLNAVATPLFFVQFVATYGLTEIADRVVDALDVVSVVLGVLIEAWRRLRSATATVTVGVVTVLGGLLEFGRGVWKTGSDLRDAVGDEKTANADEELTRVDEDRREVE